MSLPRTGFPNPFENPKRRRLAAAGPPVQPEAIIADFPGTYPVKSAIPNRAYR